MRSLVFGVIMVLGCTTAAHGISVTVQVTPAQCGLSNGTATAQVQGGQLPYTYQWNTGATTSALSGLAPGTYSVTVTDAIGDVAVGSGVVQDNSLLANIWPSTSPDCGGCSGMAWINEGNLGGTPPYSYSLPTGGMWDGNHDPAGFGWLCWGDHTIIVSDANGCSVEVNFSIGEQDTYYWPPIVDTYPACGAQANGSIALGLYSMGDPWSIVVQGPGGFDSTYVLNAPGLITGLAPGSYGVFSLEPSVCALPNSNVFVGSIPEPCGSITGVVFNDVDGNCAQDTDDIGLPFRLMTLEPGPHHAFTDSSGQFAFSTVEFGSFAVSQPLYNESQLCPPDMPIAVTVDGASPSANLLIADSSHTTLDLEMTSVLSTMRPGFVWGKEFRVR
ncbi:MAG: SprB repeat-containing protein, partial [Flavobacteriales bacterium]|nr:SprB repeat-containing protein [Flavobacteriales bacterium]